MLWAGDTAGTSNVLPSWGDSMFIKSLQSPKLACAQGGRMWGFPSMSGCVSGYRTIYSVKPIQGMFWTTDKGHQHARPLQWLALTSKSVLD